MKKTALTIFFLCFAGILTLLLHRHFKESGKETVYIALAGPMSGSSQEEGRAMLRGATLAYEEVKRDGKILKNKKIEIVPYDDKDSRTAVRIASDIVNEDKVILVLGHYSSFGSAAAGPMYKSNGIPAITASATREEATSESEWFFRTVPGNHAITQFAAYSMKDLLSGKTKTASIIYNKNFYDPSVVPEFVKQAEKRLNFSLKKWPFDSNDDDIKRIIAEIRAEQEVGPIFFATSSTDCGRVISGFRYPGTDYPIIGPDSLAVPGFIHQFNSSSEEQRNPGYYTNGIYAVSPFISYLADQPNARYFREKFVRKYGREPTWVAAAYYDAMLVALNALEQAEIQGGNIQENRRKVKDALSRINEKDMAVKGVTGDIYFNENGNVDLPLELGVWQSNEFIPAYRQYRLSNSKSSREGDQNPEETEEPETATSLRVVYTGVDINTVRNIDLKKGIFTADFYIWFRFKGTFEDRAVTFTNSVKPVTLDAAIMRETNRDDITVHAYRVVADFTFDSSTAAYPLDRHALRISFRYDKETRNTMIYVPDVVGMTGSVSKKNRGETLLEKLSGWEIAEIVSKQNLYSPGDEHKEEVSYSQIDTEIKVYRQDRWILSLKIMLPFLFVITIVYLLFYISPELIWIRHFIELSLLFLTIEVRTLYKYILPGQEIAQQMLFFILLLLLFSALTAGGSYWAHRRNHIRKAKCILYAGRFIYPVAVTAGIVFLLYSHSALPWSLQNMISNKIASFPPPCLVAQLKNRQP